MINLKQIFNLEGILKGGECPSCRTESEFKYLGVAGFSKEEKLHLYNCQRCYSISTDLQIMEHNERKYEK